MLPILTQSLWRDEAFSAIVAGKNIFEIFYLSAKDTTPPFYYILLHYWMTLFGNSELALRTMSLIFHLLTVVTIFFIAKKIIRLFSMQIAISLAILLNPFLAQYAFEARAYSLLTFLSILALYLAICRKYIWAGIALTLAILTHNFAVLNFFLFAIWWLFINREKLQLSSFLKLASLPLSAMFLWGGIVWAQWNQITHGFWIPKPTSSTLIDSFKIFSAGELSYPIKSILYSLSKILFIAAGLTWIQKYKNKNDSILLIFLLFSVPPLITFSFSQFFTPIYYERYLILTTPMLILFTGYSLERLLLKNSIIKFILGILVAIYLMVVAIAFIQVVSKSTKSPINYGVREILSRTQKDDVIIPESMLNFLETKFYVEKSGKNIPVYAYSPDEKIPFYIGGILYEPRDIIREMPKNRRIWQIKSNGGYKLLEL